MDQSLVVSQTLIRLKGWWLPHLQRRKTLVASKTLLEVKMKMEEDEVGSLQPWQIFTTMFIGFWAISAYFDHFLMTGVFCIAFGVTAEVVTKFIYGEKMVKDLPRQKEELNSLLEKQQQENEKLTEEITILTISERNENIWINAEEELKCQDAIEEEDEEEDDGPPPLPTKDYSYNNVIKSENEGEDESGDDGPPPLPTKDYSFNNTAKDEESQELLNNVTEEYKQSLIEDEYVKFIPSLESNCLSSVSKEQEIPSKEIDNFLEIEKYLSSQDDIIPSGDNNKFESSDKEQMSTSSSDLLSEESEKNIVNREDSPEDNLPHPQMNDKSEKLEEKQIEIECFGDQITNFSSEYVRTQSDELNENTYMQDLNHKDDVKDEESQNNIVIESNNTPLELKHPELSDMNCNQESNDDDSEYGLNEIDPNKVYAPDSSEDEDDLNEEFENKEVVLNESESDSGEENAKEFTSSRECIGNIGDIKEIKEQTDETPKEIMTEESPQKNVTDTHITPDLSEELNDIDLTDPALEAAATKIQSSFKGFKSRRVVKN